MARDVAFNRRTVMAMGLAGSVAPILGTARAASDDGVTVGDDGLYKQDWFLDTFLDVGEDLQEAADDGKGLLVLFEQQGCPYCRELHRVNFAKAQLRDFLTTHFNAVQMDLFGSREATDFDGEAMEERRLARRWQINFTPTTILFPPSAAGASSRAEAEAFRMPGYLKPFHYLSALEFVAGGAYRDKGFQRFLQDKFAELEAKGLKPDVW